MRQSDTRVKMAFCLSLRFSWWCFPFELKIHVQLSTKIKHSILLFHNFSSRWWTSFYCPLYSLNLWVLLIIRLLSYRSCLFICALSSLVRTHLLRRTTHSHSGNWLLIATLLMQTHCLRCYASFNHFILFTHSFLRRLSPDVKLYRGASM